MTSRWLVADPFGTRPLWDMHVLTVLRVTTDTDEDRTRSKRWTGLKKKKKKAQARNCHLFTHQEHKPTGGWGFRI